MNSSLCIMPNFHFNILIVDFTFNLVQNVLLWLPHSVTFVSHLLEPRIATIIMALAVALSSLHSSPTAVVANVTLTRSLVLPTRPPELDSGRQCT